MKTTKLKLEKDDDYTMTTTREITQEQHLQTFNSLQSFPLLPQFNGVSLSRSKGRFDNIYMISIDTSYVYKDGHYPDVDGHTDGQMYYYTLSKDDAIYLLVELGRAHSSDDNASLLDAIGMILEGESLIAS